ncbi:probable G-protein coupled receptor 139 [Latimeria chalumnae]|uniref:probable G-protein coupled receptor 139 n=1 Tax=Latimeria chalumnae TaxID=7897 RepID=UPI0003C1A89A|nr:PREDICTED: probable G-protein coupled receptor 139 [Latimeria chalumnae]|eukprot:XP_005988539.1 PREDICTED: probable G-protein coupled receptor 139 [Latimeria chalumnae]
MNEEHWMVKLQQVFYPLLAVIGIPSNIVTFLIIWRRNCMLSKSSTYYLMAISLADTLVLILIVIIELVLKSHIPEPFWSWDPWCSIRDVFSYGAYNASVWLIVTFTIERFIAINSIRLKVKVCTSRSAMIVISSVFAISHIFSIPYYWSNQSVTVTVDGSLKEVHRCIYSRDMTSLFVLGLVWIQTALSYIIPYIIIFTLNGLTLRQIVLSNKVYSHTSNITHNSIGQCKRFRSQKRKSIVLLITISMSFASLSATRLVTQIILRKRYYNIDRNDYSKAINVAADIGTMLDLTNSAINMYLYACTQTKFRQELIKCVKSIICSCKYRNPHKKARPSIIFQL